MSFNILIKQLLSLVLNSLLYSIHTEPYFSPTCSTIISCLFLQLTVHSRLLVVTSIYKQKQTYSMQT